MKIKEHKMRDKYLDLARELKKVMEHESDDGLVSLVSLFNGISTILGYFMPKSSF